MPEISVIVPVYNSEKYLRRCIDSILAQTFPDFELILVDDGSFDGSLGLCLEYAAKDKRLTVIHKENGGVSAARNTGMAAARGKYVMFCDADDWVEAHWCEYMHSVIIDNPGALVVCGVARVDDTAQSDPECAAEAIPAPAELTYFELFQKGISAYSCNKIFAMDSIRERGLIFPEDRRIGEDVFFTVDYLAGCAGILYLDLPMYCYRNHALSAMNSCRNDVFAQNVPLFRKRLPLIREEEMGAFCDTYLYMFLTWLDNIFDSRNVMPFLQKMRYNQQMMQTEEFRFCADHASGKNESPLFMKIVRTHNFYLYWLFRKAARLKEIVLRKK